MPKKESGQAPDGSGGEVFKTVCAVSLSANAGVSIQLGGHQIWIDALHTQKIPGFSGVTPELWAQLREQEAFRAPDVICFTHCHADHYSRELTLQARSLWPEAKVVLPEAEFQDQILLSGEEVWFTIGALSLRFLRLPHEGEKFAGAPHYGLLLSYGEFRVLVPGDCEVASPLLAKALEGIPVDLALLDFPWVTLRQGREFIEKILRPSHLLVYHLPFAQDETNRYRTVSERCAQRLDVPDVRLFMEPLQREVI